jgi:hypothetical protein
MNLHAIDLRTGETYHMARIKDPALRVTGLDWFDMTE